MSKSDSRQRQSKCVVAFVQLGNDQVGGHQLVHEEIYCKFRSYTLMQVAGLDFKDFLCTFELKFFFSKVEIDIFC